MSFCPLVEAFFAAVVTAALAFNRSSFGLSMRLTSPNLRTCFFLPILAGVECDAVKTEGAALKGEVVQSRLVRESVESAV